MAKGYLFSRQEKYGFIFHEKAVEVIKFNSFNDEESPTCKFWGIYDIGEALNDLYITTGAYKGYVTTHNLDECRRELLRNLLQMRCINVLYIQYRASNLKDDILGDEYRITMSQPLTDPDMLRMLNLVLLSHKMQLQPMWLEDEPKPTTNSIN